MLFIKPLHLSLRRLSVASLLIAMTIASADEVSDIRRQCASAAISAQGGEILDIHLRRAAEQGTINQCAVRLLSAGRITTVRYMIDGGQIIPDSSIALAKPKGSSNQNNAAPSTEPPPSAVASNSNDIITTETVSLAGTHEQNTKKTSQDSAFQTFRFDSPTETETQITDAEVVTEETKSEPAPGAAPPAAMPPSN